MFSILRDIPDIENDDDEFDDEFDDDGKEEQNMDDPIEK